MSSMPHTSLSEAVAAAAPAFTRPIAPGSKAIYSRDGSKVITVPKVRRSSRRSDSLDDYDHEDPDAPYTGDSDSYVVGQDIDFEYEHALQQPSIATPDQPSGAKKKKKKKKKGKSVGEDAAPPGAEVKFHDDGHGVTIKNIDFSSPQAIVTAAKAAAKAVNPVVPAASTSVSKKKKDEDRIWDTSSEEERQRIKEFWLSLSEDERRDLVKIEKDMVLQIMKDQQRNTCSCSVCGRKRIAIEEELEALYDAYYSELEMYSGRNAPPAEREMFSEPQDPYSDVIQRTEDLPVYIDHRRQIYEVDDDYEEAGDEVLSSQSTQYAPLPVPPTALPANGEANQVLPPQHSHQHHHHHHDHQHDHHQHDHDRHQHQHDHHDHPQHQHDHIPADLPPLGSTPSADDLFNFGSSLTIQGGILTVADDLLKNDGKKFIDMMEKLAGRRLAREEEALAMYDDDVDDYDDDAYEDEEDDGLEHDEDEYDDGEEDDYIDEEDDVDEVPMSDEQRMAEGKRMLQIFAARMFEQRVLNAYREKVAQERQKKLLEELEEENRANEERELKKLKDKEKKKDKKRQQKQAKEEERLRKIAEKEEAEAAARLEKEKKAEAGRLRKLELKKAQEEERKRRQEEERKREAERERKRKEKEERELQKKLEKESKEREAREFKESQEREARQQETKEKEIKERASDKRGALHSSPQVTPPAAESTLLRMLSPQGSPHLVHPVQLGGTPRTDSSPGSTIASPQASLSTPITLPGMLDNSLPTLPHSMVPPAPVGTIQHAPGLPPMQRSQIPPMHAATPSPYHMGTPLAPPPGQLHPHQEMQSPWPSQLGNIASYNSPTYNGGLSLMGVLSNGGPNVASGSSVNSTIGHNIGSNNGGSSQFGSPSLGNPMPTAAPGIQRSVSGYGSENPVDELSRIIGGRSLLSDEAMPNPSFPPIHSQSKLPDFGSGSFFGNSGMRGPGETSPSVNGSPGWGNSGARRGSSMWFNGGGNSIGSGPWAAESRPQSDRVRKTAVSAYEGLVTEGFASEGYVPAQLLYNATSKMLDGQSLNQAEFHNACGVYDDLSSSERFEGLRDNVGLITHLRLKPASTMAGSSLGELGADSEVWPIRMAGVF